MIYKTWDEWKELRHQVMQGEKSFRKNDKGKALFAEDQVIDMDEQAFADQELFPYYEDDF